MADDPQQADDQPTAPAEEVMTESSASSSGGGSGTLIGLLLLVIVAGVGIWWYIAGGGGAAEAAAKAKITELGAIVSPGGDKPASSVSVSLPNVQDKLDEIMPLVADLNKLNSFNAQHSELTNEHLKYVGRATTLADLNLMNTTISDEGLAHLTKLDNLESLALSQTAITEKGLESIAEMENLKILNISDTKVSGDLAPLGDLQTLQWVTVHGLDLSDGVADSLGKLPNFSHFSKGNANVSSAALEKLQKLRPGITID